MPTGYLLISAEPGYAESVLEALKKMKVVKETYMVYGNYDVIAKIKTDTMEELGDSILNVRLLGKVRSTQTMVVMKET